MKKIVALLTLALSFACFAAAPIYDWSDGDLTWHFTISGETATLTGVTGTIGDDLVLPSSVTRTVAIEEIHYKVVAIANGRFTNLEIKTLTIPDSVKTLGYGAFADCSSLKTVDMGNGVTTIAHAADNYWNYHPNTRDPDLEASSGAFGNCPNLEEVKFSSSLTLIGSHAFSECIALKEVVIPDSVKEIGVNCFYHNTSLASAHFGTGLVSIGTYAFYNCPELQSVTFEPFETPLLTIGKGAFAKGTKLVTLSFSNSLMGINDEAFADCTSLVELTFPNSLRTLGYGVFANCSALKTVDMGNGVTTIAHAADNYWNYHPNTQDPDIEASSGAFGNCPNLEEVKFSSSLTLIGSHAFSECIALKEIAIPDSVQEIGVNCFYHNTSLASAHFGSGLVSIGTYAFYNCPELQSVTFEPSETPLLTIGKGAFAKGTKLVTLSFSNSLMGINDEAFADCTSLVELTFPNSLKTLGYGVFANCSALKTVDMGNGVTTIAHAASNYSNYHPNTQDPDIEASSGAFGYCTNLEEVKFSSSLTLIGSHAFSECWALKSVDLPEALMTIGVNCFYHNKDLTAVTFGRRIESIGTNSFRSCPALRYVTFAETTTPLLTVQSGAFADDISLMTVTLSGGLKSIQNGAFANAPLLRKLTIPSIVTEIAPNVFSQMSALKQITFLGLPPNNLANSGLRKDIEIRYSTEWAEDWAEVITAGGFTNATAYDPESGTLTTEFVDPSYKLVANGIENRAIVLLEVAEDTSVGPFELEEGKSYDVIIRVTNTSENSISIILPEDYAYETVMEDDPRVVPAGETRLVTITRTAEATFLVSNLPLRTL